MHSTTIISFLLLLLAPLLAFAQDATTAPTSAAAEATSFSSTTTVSTTVTSTQVTFITMTGVPPSSSTSVALSPPSSNATATISKPSDSAAGNGTALATGSPSAVPFVGAAPGAFRASAGMGAVVLAAAAWLL